MDFDQVTREHITKGIRDYNETGLPKGFGPSSTYDLIVDGKKYPPKAIMAYANYHATGETPKNTFKGGPRHECFEALKREGFQITPKEQNMNLVDVKEEFAAWLLNNAPISYKNYLGRTNSSVVERLEEIDNFFMERDLFLVNGENYKDLIKYIRFKNSKNERLKNPEFYEYDRKHSRGIPIAILGKENYSKFLKEKFEFRAVNYWIFQGNPDIYNITNALNGGHLKSWKVAAHKDKIKIGDKVIIWQTGSDAGCYALAEVTSNVGVFKEEPYEMQHYVVSQNSDETDRVRLKIDKYFLEQPILWSQIKDLPEFANFKAGNQGTNFTATKAEYDTLLNLGNGIEFSWVETHREIVNYLKKHRNSQDKLIKLLDSVGITPLKDKASENDDYSIPLTEIDPFTFFCYIHKFGDANRLLNLQKIAEQLGIHSPNDVMGLPNANAQKVWLFPPKYLRINDEIDKLWHLFMEGINHEISDSTFQEALKIKNVGKTKITEALFYIDSEHFFPINGPTKPYLEEVLDIDSNFNSYSEYQKILEQIRNKTDEPFYKLSYTARLWSDSYEDEDSSDFIEYLNGFSKKDLNIYFPFLFHVLDKFNLKKGDERLLFSTKRNRISFVIGQRYSWALFKSNREGKFVVLSKDKIRTNSKRFSGNAPHPYYTHLNEINFSKKDEESIFSGFEQELKRTNKTGFKKHNNEDFENAVFDQSFRKQFIKTEIMESNKTVLNKILFGPPGTGKTYNTINDSLKIIDPEFYHENKNERNYLNKRFKELLIKDFEDTKGQIAFCTFHQSFSYEDFVEGIKPKINDKKEVYYEVVDGIFKKICQLANSSVSAVKMHKEGKLSWDEAQFEQASFYKLSLGESTNLNDRIIYEYCRDTNVVSVGFGDDTDFSGMSENEINKKCEELGLSEGSARRLNYFIHDLKKGNYVLVSNGNKYISCLGKVVGDYEYIEDSPIAYHHFRKVEWIFVDENIPVKEVYDTNFNQKTIYQLDKNRLKMEFFVDHAHKVGNESKKVKDYILIIDEINRGNVSSIFGELITLIEPDKRAGKIEELEVILPYSKEPFKVPHNVYIIGTMNTADRSIEALDTALRRRFSFVEKPPIPKLIRKEGKSGKVNGIVNGINLQKVLETINERIEKLIDKDHKIGHSYFLKVDNTESLINCFENEVIPLLEEYFFGDYGKIGLVLGDSFVSKDETKDFKFAEFAGYDADVSDDLKERSVYKIRPSKDWDFNSI